MENLNIGELTALITAIFGGLGLIGAGIAKFMGWSLTSASFYEKQRQDVISLIQKQLDATATREKKHLEELEKTRKVIEEQHVTNHKLKNELQKMVFALETSNREKEARTEQIRILTEKVSELTAQVEHLTAALKKYENKNNV